MRRAHRRRLEALTRRTPEARLLAGMLARGLIEPTPPAPRRSPRPALELEGEAERAAIVDALRRTWAGGY